MNSCSRFCSVLTVGMTAALVNAQEPAKGRTWKPSSQPAEVVAATFLGGAGTEWLAAGGFQPDGTIVLAGNVAGDALQLAAPATVLGTDRPSPGPYVPVIATGKQAKKLAENDKPVIEKPSWRHDGVTGFIVRCSGDLQKVLSVHRLPWTAGAITATEIGPDGSIYIAGRATEGIGNLTAERIEEFPVRGNAVRPGALCGHIFVAKLSPDGARVLWVRQSKGPSGSPRLDWSARGELRLIAQEIFYLSADGKLNAAVEVPGGVRTTASVDPRSGTIVSGGEHPSPTGREPWRCPTLNIHDPDGSLRYQLYDWGGPFVGLDSLRLVSDTAVRWVTHDRDGSILLYAWSDGGNSVMTAQPADVRRPVGHKGLGITAARAGVLSAAYLVRIDPRDYHVSGWTIWLAFNTDGRPNSIWIDTLGVADDRSLLLAGRGAWGIVQTENKLSSGEPTGPYLAVLNPQLNEVRFCTTIAGACAAEIAEGSASKGTGWGLARGTVQGKQRALFLTGVAPPVDPSEGATPVRAALQPAFSGGLSGGYAALVEFDPASPESSLATANAPEPAGSRASFERGVSTRSPKLGTPPAEDVVYQFGSTVPKWFTVDAELRDREGKLWPSFLIGRPESGSLTVRGGLLSGQLELVANRAIQGQGDQNRRVLGSLPSAEQPATLRLKIDSISPVVKTLERTVVDGKGKSQLLALEYVEATGTLELNGQTIAVAPKLTYSFGKTSGVYSAPGKISSATESIRGQAWITFPARALGLNLTGDVDLRVGFCGVAASGN